MNSPELPDRPAPPTIDDSLFELNGTIFKDLSHSAAAKRAAYLDARAAYLDAKALRSASSSNAPAHEQTLSALGPTASFTRLDNFQNYGTAPGYTAEYGNQGPGQEGWIMHSQLSDSSRLRFNFAFNDGSTPYTYIRVFMRGAPDNGKDSYACLIEEQRAEAPPPPPGTPPPPPCDEVDIVEYYGQTGSHRSEWAIYQNGEATGTNVGHGTYPTPVGDAGEVAYIYAVYLENGNYIRLANFSLDGAQLGAWERHASQGYVQTRSMYLYAGIWDCSASAPDACVGDSEPFTGDSSFALGALYMDTGG
jgi:hypothetical protein